MFFITPTLLRRKTLLYNTMRSSLTAFIVSFVCLLPTHGQDTIPATESCSWAATIGNKLDSLTHLPLTQHTQMGLYVYDLTADKPLFAHNIHQQLRPASCQKLVTAISALKVLGSDFCFRTTLAYTGTIDDSVLTGDIWISGSFDPLFSRSDLNGFVKKLTDAGIRRIEGQIRFDRSLCDTVKAGPGWCWDDDNPPLTPLLLNGKNTLETSWLDALTRSGITHQSDFAYGHQPAEATQLATVCHTIDQVLLPMMKESNNLCAEALFMRLAARCGKPYAGLKEATSEINSVYAEAGVDAKAYEIADGSGLSLYNYTTPHCIVALLRMAWQTPQLRRHLVPSLPVAATDGTLRKRMKGTLADGNVKAKTGTVTGVSTLSGYATAPNGHTLCFAILNQGLYHTADGRRFQDAVCTALTTP